MITATKEIKSMSAIKLMKNFCDCGDAVDGVDIEQDFDNETTTIYFDNATVEINNSQVKWV